MAKPINYTRNFFRLILFILVAIPILAILGLGKFFFRNKEIKLSNLSMVNKAEADVPGNCGAGGCGGGPAGEGGNCGCGCGGASGGCGAGTSQCGTCSSATTGGCDSSGWGDPGPGRSSGEGGSDGSGDSCFEAGTLVAVEMKNRKKFIFKKIEDLILGDYIVGISFDGGGQPVIKKSKVKKTLRHDAKERNFMELKTQKGASVVATHNHRFITDSQNGAVRLDEIQLEEIVVSAFSEPKWDVVSEVKSAHRENSEVFNIETETSNYLVSEDGKGWILVHNYK